jgi:glycosyltransferase involved in cell wall biosynthesis
VTVGLAVYNGAATLASSLESVRAQTYTDYEILVIDDGSTDGSGEIAASFGARVLRQENQGLGAGRKRLVEEAQGELIAFIDADDEWVPTKLETQVALLDQTKAALVHSDCWYIYEDGRVVERNWHAPSHSSAFSHILPSNVIIASSAVFSRQKMLEAGNFVSDTVRCSDWYGWFLLAKDNVFWHLPEKQVRYKVLSSSLANAGYRFHEAQRYLLQEKILPRFDELFGNEPPNERRMYRRMLDKDLGIALSSMAKYLDKQGKRDEARDLHRQAVKLAPNVFRIWTRMLRSYLP